MEGHTHHGRKCKGPANGFAPPWVHVGIVVDQWLIVYNVEDEDALCTQMCLVTGPHYTTLLAELPQPYHADQWGEEGPAPFHPRARSVPNHTGNVIHESVSSCNRVRWMGRIELDTIHLYSTLKFLTQSFTLTYRKPKPPPHTPKRLAKAG